MTGKNAALYERDFFRWTEEQAAALRKAARSGADLPLDWENLAEEVESLGISQKYELRNRLAVILEHLLNLEHSPAKHPRRGRMATIARERLDVERLLEDSPSLRREVPSMHDRPGKPDRFRDPVRLRRDGGQTPDAGSSRSSASGSPSRANASPDGYLTY